MERHRERGEKSHGVTLHAENHPVTAPNQLTPFQKIMCALEVAAAMDGRVAAFPERRKNPQENPLAVAFDYFYFSFLLGFGFLSLHGGCDYSQFLVVLCPRAKGSADGE